jgi:hypothetical protein
MELTKEQIAKNLQRLAEPESREAFDKVFDEMFPDEESPQATSSGSPLSALRPAVCQCVPRVKRP